MVTGGNRETNLVAVIVYHMLSNVVVCFVYSTSKIIIIFFFFLPQLQRYLKIEILRSTYSAAWK